jgi:IMP cyclohydrolase
MKHLAERNVKTHLKDNEYPGRGIVVGATPDGSRLVQVYWIMGRSENSQNRVFLLESDIIKTAPYDPLKVKDPSLIIYHALRHLDTSYIVSNGDQTDTVYDALQAGGSFESGLSTRTFEPDRPNYTPRVSGIIQRRGADSMYKLNILKALYNNPDLPAHQTFYYKKFIHGFGHCFHTYKENGDPLPPFEGEPYLVPIPDTIDRIAEFYWSSLNEGTRVSLAVKTIDPASGAVEYKIVNKHS